MLIFLLSSQIIPSGGCTVPLLEAPHSNARGSFLNSSLLWNEPSLWVLLSTDLSWAFLDSWCLHFFKGRQHFSDTLCACMLRHVNHVWFLVDCNPPGSSVHGILQARILEWVAISFSRSDTLGTRKRFNSGLLERIKVLADYSLLARKNVGPWLLQHNLLVWAIVITCCSCSRATCLWHFSFLVSLPFSTGEE